MRTQGQLKQAIEVFKGQVDALMSLGEEARAVQAGACLSTLEWCLGEESETGGIFEGYLDTLLSI